MELREHAIAYLKSLDSKARKSVKEMQRHGVICGNGYAEKNGLDPQEFDAELKSAIDGKY